MHQGEQVFELPTKTEMSKFCSQRELKHFLEPVSTYLSISVKGVNIDSLIDRDAKLVAQNLEGLIFKEFFRRSRLSPKIFSLIAFLL